MELPLENPMRCRRNVLQLIIIIGEFYSSYSSLLKEIMNNKYKLQMALLREHNFGAVILNCRWGIFLFLILTIFSAEMIEKSLYTGEFLFKYANKKKHHIKI